MYRILAVAVGQGADANASAVARTVIKTPHSKEMRPYVAGLISGLEKLGLKPGTDFEIDYATAEPKTLKKLVKAAIDQHKPDAMFAMSTTAVKVAMSVSKDIPIVFPSISDPVEDGVAKSCSVPGMNATGIRSMRRQSVHEGLELFKMTVPSLKTVYGLHKPLYGPATRALAAVKKAAKKAKVAFKPVTVRSHKDIAKALDAISQSGAAGSPQVGVMVMPDDLVLSAWRYVAETAQEKKLPTFYPVTDWVREGSSAFAGYGVPQHTGGEAAAAYMRKVLDGVPAKHLPIHRVGGFEWAVNRNVARALGLTIPEHVLKAADRVVG
jgi:putative tryptophan/tyrosine transport system substrate-binding protein